MAGNNFMANSFVSCQAAGAGSKLGKGPQDAQAGVAALFGVELGAVDPAGPHHPGDGDGILADGQGAGGAVLRVIAVDVIDMLPLPDVAEQRVVPEDVEGVPADLGHFERRVGQVGGQGAYLPRHQAEAGVLPVFKAAVEQQLHPQADAQQGLLGGLLPQHRDQPGGPELVHGVPKGAHPGQDDPVRRPDPGGVGGDGGVQPQAPQAGAEAEQVAHPVINDSDHTSSPFVEGISSRCAWSTWTAAARARAIPFQQASRIWWLLPPANWTKCSVAGTLRANPSQNSRAHSTSKSPTFSVGQRTSQFRVQRPDRSTAARTSASSIGRQKLPYRRMPRISPSPRRNACPRAMPTSSAVW